MKWIMLVWAVSFSIAALWNLATMTWDYAGATAAMASIFWLLYGILTYQGRALRQLQDQDEEASGYTQG